MPTDLREAIDVGVRRISDDDWSSLHGEERSLVERAVWKRRREFATGRRLLRDLLDDERPIGRRHNGAPMLPDEVVGSLAHDQTFAVAAVSRHASIFGIGIDVEIDRPALGQAEIDLIVRTDDVSPAPLASFVMKEATYKAWSRSGVSDHTDRILEHSDVRVITQENNFRATVLVDGFEFDGRFTQLAGRWLALTIARTSILG